MELDILITICLVLAIAIIGGFAQVSVKKSYKDKENRGLFFILSNLLYTIVCILVLFTYQYRTMAMVNVLWSGISICVVFLYGHLFYDEKVTMKHIIASALLIIGIGLVLSNKHSSHIV